MTGLACVLQQKMTMPKQVNEAFDLNFEHFRQIVEAYSARGRRATVAKGTGGWRTRRQEGLGPSPCCIAENMSIKGLAAQLQHEVRAQ